MINDYGTFIEQTMIDFYNKHRSEYNDYTSYCLMNCYFITLTFDRTKIERKYDLSPGTHRGAFEFENFHRLYNSVCSSLVGRHYDKARNFDRLPLAITALDVEGTRYATSMPALKNLHFHSIWMSTPEFTNEISNIVMNPGFLSKTPRGSDFDNIHVETLSASQNASISSRLTEYISKSVRMNERDISLTEDIRVYPISKEHMKTIERFRPE